MLLTMTSHSIPNYVSIALLRAAIRLVAVADRAGTIATLYHHWLQPVTWLLSQSQRPRQPRHLPQLRLQQAGGKLPSLSGTSKQQIPQNGKSHVQPPTYA